MGRRFIEINQEEVYRLRAQGKTLHEIAAALDTNVATLSQRFDLPKPKIRPFICCDKRFTSAGFLRKHRTGVLHQNRDRIKALLARNCMTFTEIGKRLGVTREAVRQMSKQLNIGGNGNKRRTLCFLARQPSDPPEIPH